LIPRVVGYSHREISVIPNSRRLTVIPHFILGGFACLGALVDRSSYRAAIYDSLFQYISLSVWAAAFGFSALMAGITLITGIWRTYVAANLSMMAISVSWLVALLNARFVDHIDVTALTFGLWLFIVITCFVNAAVPITVITVGGNGDDGS
jgi:hypothetical protein